MVWKGRHTKEPSTLKIIIYAIVAIVFAAFAVLALISQEMPADWYPTVTTEVH